MHQSDLLDQRAMVRKEKRQCKIVERMQSVPALPRGLKGWLHREVMPAYFFYDKKNGKKPVKGTCTSCGKEIELENVKYNEIGKCPHCKRELIMKSRGRRGRIIDRTTCQVIQKAGPNNLVARIIKVHYDYISSDTPRIYIGENARIFFDCTNGTAAGEEYYYSYNETGLTKWRKGSRPVISRWRYNFDADICGHVYHKNLKDELADTPWKHCPIEEFYLHFREPMQIEPVLRKYLEIPKIELLIKTGFCKLTADLVYSGYYANKDILDLAQNRTHRVLRVSAEDVAFLRDNAVDIKELKMFQEYSAKNIKNRQMLFLWQRKYEINSDVGEILEHITAYKLIQYINKQYSFLRLRKTEYGGNRYNSMQSLVREYRDYLAMCKAENHDMSRKSVLYPKDLQKQHDKLVHRIKVKADAKTRRDFKQACLDILGKYDYEKNGLKIIYPSKPEDLVAEGKALNHCVGNARYIDGVANRESIILFIRQCEKQEEPFYTFEVKDNKVEQIHGVNHVAPTRKVEEFMDEWKEKFILNADRLNAA